LRFVELGEEFNSVRANEGLADLGVFSVLIIADDD
jgi:hypothetical protein